MVLHDITAFSKGKIQNDVKDMKDFLLYWWVLYSRLEEVAIVVKDMSNEQLLNELVVGLNVNSNNSK